MPPVRFEPTISAVERSQTHALDRAATGTGTQSIFCLLSCRYNPLWLYFHSPVAGFILLVVEVSWSHTTMRHSR
jgi:hypothetical protein